MVSKEEKRRKFVATKEEKRKRYRERIIPLIVSIAVFNILIAIIVSNSIVATALSFVCSACAVVLFEAPAKERKEMLDYYFDSTEES